MALLGMGGLIRSSASAAVDDPFAGMFTMIVQTDNSGTSGTDQFTIPTTGTGYNYSTKMQLVGGSTITETSGNTGSVTLTGADGAGQYKVGISGDFPRIYFNNGGDKLKLLEWQSAGEVLLGADQSAALYGCSNCTVGPLATFEAVTKTSSQFRDSSITSLPLATFASVTNATSQFLSSSITSLPLATFEAVTNATSQFLSSSITSLPLATFASVTSATSQFLSSSITSLPLATFEAVTNATNQFRNSSITSLPLATFASVTNASSQFQDSTLTTSGYSDLLIRIEANNPNTEVEFHGGNSKYNAAGQTARNALLARSPAWTITDGGLET